MSESLLPRLKTLRNERGMTQAQLAEELGAVKRTVIRWEMGDNSPTLKDLIGIAKLFDVSVAYLIGETERRTFT